MIPSPACETFIKGFETCRLSAFKPTPNDVWTIGWGRTTGVWAGMTEDQAQADADFTAAMALFGRGVTQELDGAPHDARTIQCDGVLCLQRWAGQ